MLPLAKVSDIARDPDDEVPAAFLDQAALEPFKVLEWEALTPGERLARAWALRERLTDPEGTHDSKLFPAP